MSRIIYLLMICLSLVFVTAGCDGSGSNSSSNSEYVSGVAATGAPAADTLVTLTDSNGEVKTTTSGSDGSYSIEVTGMTAPYVIWFETGGKAIYATNCGSDKVNVTPFSDVVTRAVYQQAGGEGNPDASMIPDGECTTVQNQIKEIIEPVLELYGLDKDTDFISQEDFSADTFGLDGIFDDYSMEINDEGNFVLSSRTDNQPIINVSVDNISTPAESVEDADLTETITLRMLNHVADETSFEDFGGDNSAISSIVSNLNLFTTTHNGVSASWSSSNTSVVSDAGEITAHYLPTTVTLTLTLSKNGYDVTRNFTLMVTQSDCTVYDEGAVHYDKEALTFDSIKGSNTAVGNIRTDLTLPTSGSCGSTISWASTDEDVVATDGEVIRYITENKTATLTATIRKGNEIDTKTFDTMTLPAAAVSSINFMAYFVHALTEDDILWTWGDNRHGNLGDGTTTDSYDPKLLPSPFHDMSNLRSISATSEHTLALKNDGTIWAWGENTYGELGINSTDDALTPVQVGDDTDWAKIHASNYNSFAVKTDGTLWSWGRNDHGQLGDGTTTNSHIPKQVNNDTDWDYVMGAMEHFIGVKTDGSLFIWGWNANGQIGDGTTNDLLTPTNFGSSISDWKSLALGYRHIIGVRANGELWAWGRNSDGAYGDGTNTSVTSPQQIGSDTDWSKVHAGQNYSFAIKDNGNIYATGNNGSGRLGIGSATGSFNTFQLFGTTADWQTFHLGFDCGFGIKTDGTVWAWGTNSSGQYGNGTTTNSTSPVQVFPRP